MIPSGWIDQQILPAPASIPAARIDFEAGYSKRIADHFAHIEHTLIAESGAIDAVDVNYFARYTLEDIPPPPDTDGPDFIPFAAYLRVVINGG